MTAPLRVMPDVVAVVIAHLRAQPELTALLPDPKNVRGKIPDNPTWPLIRVTRIGSEALVANPHELDLVAVQLDAYGGNDAQAEALGQMARATMPRLLEDPTNQVNSVAPTNFFGDPDETQEPTRARYIALYDVGMRPATHT